jgi:hypothetical protein
LFGSATAGRTEALSGAAALIRPTGKIRSNFPALAMASISNGAEIALREKTKFVNRFKLIGSSSPDAKNKSLLFFRNL